jgi:hypothetical protein
MYTAENESLSLGLNRLHLIFRFQIDLRAAESRRSYAVPSKSAHKMQLVARGCSLR